ELDDVDIAPLVIGVAEPAVPVCRLGLTSVETPARLPVRRDVLMAAETGTGLRLPRERNGAPTASPLALGMPPDEPTRHDQLFDRVRRSGRPMGRDRQARCDRERHRDGAPEHWSSNQ